MKHRISIKVGRYEVLFKIVKLPKNEIEQYIDSLTWIDDSFNVSYKEI